MREILFRGQTRRKGEKVRMDGTPVESNWVYGGVLQGTGDFSIIYQTKPSIEKMPVYTNTLGQYTGLTDKNSVKIFEGDIIQNVTEGKTAVVQWFSEYSAFMLWCKSENQVYWLYDNDFLNIEVIGNIYNNPELLGDAKMDGGADNG